MSTHHDCKHGKSYWQDCKECKAAELSNSAAMLGSTLDEFELMDRLATMIGVAGPESQEERNTSPIYQRNVLRKAISALEQAWQKKA